MDTKRTGLELRSLVKSSGELELSLVSTVIPAPAPDEVVVRIEASPINPSDIGLLFGAADMSTANASGSAASPVVTASIPERFQKAWPVGWINPCLSVMKGPVWSSKPERRALRRHCSERRWR